MSVKRPDCYKYCGEECFGGYKCVSGCDVYRRERGKEVAAWKKGEDYKPKEKKSKVVLFL